MKSVSLVHITSVDKATLAKGAAFQKKITASLPIAGNRKLMAKVSQDFKAGIGGRIASGIATVMQLTNLKSRAEAVCRGQNLIAAQAWFKDTLEKMNSEDNGKKIADMVAATMGDDSDSKAAKAALGKMIAVNVGHLIRYTGSWVQWYQSVSLAEDAVPYLRNYVPQQTNVRIGNGDGYLTTHDASPDLEDDKAIKLFFIISDMFRAKLFDEYKGNIANAGLAVVDISMDLAEKIDALLQVPITVGTPNSVFTGTFVNDGTPASHYHASSRIDTSNYPTGNIIAPSDNGGTTVPRLSCIKVIDKYFSQFGAGFSPSGDMVPVAVHVSSKMAASFGDEFTVNSHQNVYTDAVFRNRGSIPFNGRNYEIIPDPTISPTDKHLYVRSNMPVGLFLEKPAGSLVHREEDVVTNEVMTFERALIGYAFPVTWAPHALAVRFQS